MSETVTPREVSKGIPGGLRPRPLEDGRKEGKLQKKQSVDGVGVVGSETRSLLATKSVMKSRPRLCIGGFGYRLPISVLVGNTKRKVQSS